MQIFGIVTEYNPFHNGHLFQINRIRDFGATHIVSVMSGNYVQRGEPALFDKWTRAKAAVLSGVDLVIELPTPYGILTAEKFAFNSIYILNSLGCVDFLNFGSECGDIDLLKRCADAVVSPDLSNSLSIRLDSGLSFAKARCDAVSECFDPSVAGALMSPNNILGVEYIKALNRLGSAIKPQTLTRIGTAHDSNESCGYYASASFLRNLNNLDKARRFMPEGAFSVYKEAEKALHGPIDFKKAEIAVLSKLRQMSKDDFLRLPDISEGLENRIFAAVSKAKTLEQLYSLIKTKRYSHSRIRRIILAAYLSLYDAQSSRFPSYIRVLAANKRGLEIIKKAKSSCALPIDFSLLTLSKFSAVCRADAEFENMATNLYTLMMPKILSSGLEFTHEPIIIE